jgi:hypothetical protein
MAGFLGGTVGGAIGWWLGEGAGYRTAFLLSMVGTGVGMHYAVKLARERLP